MKGVEMTAQIIEFPMDRVRKVSNPDPVRRAVRPTHSTYVRPSIKITRAIIFWSLVSAAVYGLFFSSVSINDSAQANSTKSTTGQVQQFAYVTVMSGQTLWDLAEEYAPDRDPRDFISDLIALNNLNSSSVDPGMQLALPKY
ncbi:MAG: LysM peptidoglycan-binding domain-containing protein [Micrococcales bacterium]|nr:LysM peptidoglycan-binding domain-containing protein [Micrococcales bacterium]